MLEHGGDITGYWEEYGICPLDFSANIAPLGVPQPVRNAVIGAIDHASDYPDPLCRDLVQALSQHEQVPASALLCGNGSSDVLFRLALAMKPRRALLCAPTFSEYEQAFTTTNTTIDYYLLSEHNNFAVTSNFTSYITPETDIVVLCQPNNPTGEVVARKLLKNILARCEECSALLVVDECFVGFLDNPQNISVVPWVEQHPNLLVLKAFTKLYGIPGIRLGYAVSSNLELIEAMRTAGQPWSVSNLAQAAGIAALQCTDYVEQVRHITQNERVFLKDELLKRGIVSWGQANFLFFHLPGQTTAPSFAQRMREMGVLVRDCSNYRNLEQGWYRIAVRTHEENLRLLSALDVVLQRTTQKGNEA